MPQTDNVVLTDELRAQLDQLLGSTDLSQVTAEGSGFQELPVGYYLAEVKKAVLTVSKSSGFPMVSIQLQIVSDGLKTSDDVEDSSLVAIPHTKGRMVFIHYPFKDGSSVTRFASDMEKFEGDKPGEPLLPKEAFSTSATLEESLSVLEEVGPRIWINNSISRSVNPQTGKPGTFSNMISWKRALQLGLPEE